MAVLGRLQRNTEASPLSSVPQLPHWCLLITPRQMSARSRQGACSSQLPAWCSGCLSPAAVEEVMSPRPAPRPAQACSAVLGGVDTALPQALIRPALTCTYFPLLCDVGCKDAEQSLLMG